jgi:sugar lactone lactonase YvrE
MVTITAVGDATMVLGEGPVWNAQDGRLYMIDCVGSRMAAYAPETGLTEVWSLPEYPGSYAFMPDGGVLMAFRRKLARLRLVKGKAEIAAELDCGIDFEVERINDGAIDVQGRFWFGTMDRRLTQPIGHLYCLGLDGLVSRQGDGIVLSNGIAWNQAQTVLYHCDSGPGVIYAYDFDASDGQASHQRVFARLREGHSSPDGCTLDAQGGLWVVEVGAGRLVRYNPDGTVDRRLDVPVTRPTAVAFGGKDMATLFMTSMTYDLSEAERQAQPDAGKLFAITGTGCTGMARPLYLG